MKEAAGGSGARVGAIHDLGYKRYVGTRRPQSTRWQVITRHQLASAWKTWWRYKMWLAVAVIITIVIGAIMVVSKSESLGDLRKAGVIVRLVDGLVFGSVQFYAWVGFLVSLTVGAGVIAGDIKTGAFTFYFARPVRTIDYVLGKLAGLFLVQAFVILLPMLALTLVRLGLSQDTDELVGNLQYLPKTILVGGLGALAYASASLGFSALLNNPRQTVALWAALYLIGGSIVTLISEVTKTPWIGAMDISLALQSLALRIFDVDALGRSAVAASIPTALLSLAIWIGFGVAASFFRIQQTGHEGIGGVS
ncbi:MAG: ABC transporter permease [Kofleriaceae bacterium]|nr:ABC transporter permease [Myxococcales bacterium]MCB9572610.1 ABC transporter permease [Kofleriaceae bacterium]